MPMSKSSHDDLSALSGDAYDVPRAKRLLALGCVWRNAKGDTDDERRNDFQGLAEHLGLTDLLPERAIT